MVKDILLVRILDDKVGYNADVVRTLLFLQADRKKPAFSTWTGIEGN